MFCLPTRARDQRGAAVVEFALIGTLLMTLVLGIISYGFMLSFRQGISQGAAEGARAAVVASLATSQKGDAVNAVNEALKSYGVTCSIPSGNTGTLTHAGSSAGTCSVTVAACPFDTAHQCVNVALTYNYRDHSLIPSFPGLDIFLPSNLNYTASARVS
jgi:Flp pilus assembly protein TadG